MTPPRFARITAYGVFERISLPLALLVLVAAIAVVYRDAVLFRSARQDAFQAEQVVATTGSLLSALKDAETGQRGYLLTGKVEYLEPYDDALSAIHGDLDKLKRQLNLPADKVVMPGLERIVNKKLVELKTTIDFRKHGDPASALNIVLGGSGKAAMDEIRSLCSVIDESARTPMLASQQIADTSATSLRWLSIGSLLVLFLLLLVALITIGRATTARVRLIRELDLREREATHAKDTLELTLRSIGDAVISTDDKGEIRFMNKCARSLTGWDNDSGIGQPLSRVFRIVNERTRDTVESPVEKVLRLDAVVGLANHTVLISRNGREVPIDDSAAPIRDADGKLLGVVLVFRDISERRRAEKAIEEGRAELSRSNAALQRSNADLETLAYAIGHDLQEPLRTIASFTQLLTREVSEPKALGYADFIVAGVNRMSELIRDLLEYAQVTHSAAARTELVNFQEVIGEVLWNLQARITETGAVIQPTTLPIVAADRRAVVQVLQNLVSNAIKYAGTRRPEVTVSAEQRSNGDWVFHVRDNGIGIDMRHADKIFEMFKRLHARDEYSGTGIGLAICKRIVELHGGSIWVESQPGQGSTFSFTLPSGDRVPVRGQAQASG